MGRKRIHELNTYKLSVNIDDSEKNVLTYIASKLNLKLGPCIMYILRMILFIPPKIKNELYDFIVLQMQRINRLYYDAGEIEQQELNKEKEYYKRLYDLIIGTDVENMIEIKIKEGVLRIPYDWIVVNLEDSLKYKYAAVMECHNSKKYGIPHFIMLTNHKYTNEYDEEFYNKFKDLCCLAWPSFKDKVIDNQVPLIKGVDGKYNNLDEHNKAPTIHITQIYEDNDSYFELYESSPYGTKIIRNK